MVRYNSTLNEFEGYGGSSPAWGPVTTTTNITGTIGASGSGLNVELAAGSAADPSLTFNEDTTTGLYQGGTSDYLFVTTGGTESAAFDNAGNLDLTNGSNTSSGAYQINGTTILALPDKDTTSIAVGKSALAAQNATSSGNVAVGDLALTTITNGTDSTAVGYEALYKATGSPNEAFGYGAGQYITAGADNIAIGYNAMTGTSANPLTATGAGNIAIGDNALAAITGGATSNIAIGYNALATSTVHSTVPNLAIGPNAMEWATTATGDIAIGNNAMQGTSGNAMTGAGYNAAIGDSALALLQTTATYNTAIGYQAMTQDLTGINNTAIGAFALSNITNVNGSTAIGPEALQTATGGQNTAIGAQAGRYISSGTTNTAIGYIAMTGTSANPITGTANTAIGYNALNALTGSAASTTAIGSAALTNATTGPNTAIGTNALLYLTTGTHNTAIGFDAMLGTSANPLTGVSAANTAIGDAALNAVTGAADNNTAIGYAAGGSVSSGTDNTLIGYEAGDAVTGSHNIVLGESTTITSGSSNIVIGNTSAEITATSSSQIDIGDTIVVAGDGHLAVHGSTPSQDGTGCGNSGFAIAGNDNVMVITQGSTSSTTCLISFATTWTSTPVCEATFSASGFGAIGTSATSTVLTLNLASSLNSKTINVICQGYK
jgi:trimeric autotransporter adhesin